MLDSFCVLTGASARVHAFRGVTSYDIFRLTALGAYLHFAGADLGGGGGGAV